MKTKTLGLKMDSEEVVDLKSVKGEVSGLSRHLNPSWNAENRSVYCVATCLCF